jgi:hypothetical protein
VALLSGAVPPCWYRHEKAVLAANAAEQDRSG